MINPPGGVLGWKNGGGVPRAVENWTLKDQGKNGIWDQKDPILEGLVPKKIVLVLVDEQKYSQKIVFSPQKLKKGGQISSTYVSTNIEGVPSSGSLLTGFVNNHINSLAPERYESNFAGVFFKLIFQVDT